MRWAFSEPESLSSPQVFSKHVSSLYLHVAFSFHPWTQLLLNVLIFQAVLRKHLLGAFDGLCMSPCIPLSQAPADL